MGFTGVLQIFAHRGRRERQTARHLALIQTGLHGQPQHLTNLAHRLPLVGHRPSRKREDATAMKPRMNASSFAARKIPVDPEKLSSFKPESVSSLDRNHCPVCSGMAVHFGPESLSSLGRNTHRARRVAPVELSHPRVERLEATLTSWLKSGCYRPTEWSSEALTRNGSNTLLRTLFVSPICQADMRVVALVTDGDSVHQILEYIGEMC